MRKSLPVMNVPSAPIRSAAGLPTSSGVPARPAGDLGHYAQGIAAFGKLVGVDGVFHLVRLEYWQSQQIIGWRHRERGILLGCQRAMAVTRLRGYDNAGAATGYNIAEFLKHQRRAVEIDSKDGRWRGLRGGDAGGVDEAGVSPSAVAV